MLMKSAAEADFAEVVALANWAYRGREGAEQSWNIEAGILSGQRLDEQSLREDLATKPGGTLLAFREAEGEPLLGTAWVNPWRDGIWYLGLLTVRPDRQESGFGKLFLAMAEQFVRDCGATRMRISVLHVREPLLGWYERRGYRRTGETEPFPYGDERFGRPLVNGLHFILMEKDL